MVRTHVGDHGGRYREVPQAIWGLAEAGCQEGQTHASRGSTAPKPARPPLTCPCDMSSV
jgi:hypothetical protein